MHNVCTRRMYNTPWEPELHSGGIGVHAVRLTHSVIARARTVPSFGFSRTFDMSDAMARSWAICRWRPSTSGHFILVQLTGFARPLNCIYQVAIWWYWPHDVNFERRMRTHGLGVLARWHNVELLAKPPAL